MLVEFFKESDKVHACLEVANIQQREEWNHHPRGTMVTDTEDSDLDDKDSATPSLIYPEESKDEESLSDPPSAESTPEIGPPSEKTTKELTSEPDYDALSEPSAPTRENSMGHLSQTYIVTIKVNIHQYFPL